MTIDPNNISTPTAVLGASSSQNGSESQGIDRSAAPAQAKQTKKAKKKIALKSPLQERSKITVKSILDSCANLIVLKGFFGLTTELIAKDAGVSIGSLYQFFGNKESVVSALIQDLFESDRMHIESEMNNVLGLSPEIRIKKFIDVTIDLHQQKADLRARVQHLQIYLSDKNFYLEKMKFYQTLIEGLISDATGTRNAQLMAQVMAQAFVGIVSSSTKDTLDLRSDAVRRELYLLFKSYMKSEH